MDFAKLKAAEEQFLGAFPGGFENPEMVKIGKKHKMPQMVELCHQLFSKSAFRKVDETCENMIKVINRSSMISLFEKPKFKEMIKSLNPSDKAFVVNGMSNLIHGNQQNGFEALVDFFKIHKLAKWSLLTIIPAYYHSQKEVFVKPTTAKNAVKYFELTHLTYKPTPSWEFYTGYREFINQAKEEVDPSLSPSNPAFSGFLMMSMSR